MIIREFGAEFLYDGITYHIGDEVIGTNESEYEGLWGRITEIRTDDDKDTDNETPDIYCSFEPPVLPTDIKRVEKVFTDSYGMEKTVDDIIWDLVIMAPRMVMPLCNSRQKIIVYALEEDWAVDTEYGHSVHLYSSESEAKAYLNKFLFEENNNGCIAEWKDKSDFKEESNELKYECWLDGEYCNNHYSLYIDQYELCLDPFLIGNIGRMYNEQSLRQDFIEQIEFEEEVSKLNSSQYERLKADACIPKRIHSALGKNDSYWECYWETVSEVAHKIVTEHIKRYEVL